ncbi:MAG: DUF4136 domain-containing protein [Ginsengibacter sp.]
MKKLLTNWWLICLAVLYFGCTKDPLNNLNTDESRIYITDRDSSVNFSSYKTYSISDSVAVIDNEKSTRQLNDVDQAYIDAVKKYMKQAGYQLVLKSDNPDLGVNVNHIISTSTGVISYGNYWGNYGGYFDPYYWGYPGYGYYIPYTYSVYSIKKGAISVDMLDLKSASKSDNKKIDVIWTGLIRGSGIFNTSVADTQVQSLFDQSSYLKKN